MKFNLENLS